MNPKFKKKFIKFIILIVTGFILGFLTFRKGFHLTPESFKALVISLGFWGPVIYTGIFIIRPLFLIPSIALFIAGGLAYGPVIGPLYASLGSLLGGTLGFWIARKMGHDYVKNRLKLGSELVDNTRFSFSVVFLLSLIPVMPVTAINYGAGLSTMRYGNYISAHALGMIPRAFAYGFFGSTLLELGSAKFRVALMILVLMSLLTLWFRVRSRRKRATSLAEETSS